jgi:hypothetical protein
VNGQVEAFNKSLKTILQHTVNVSSFSSFQLIHGLEAVLPIECEIPSLNIIIEILPDSSELEAHLVHLEHLDEKHRDATTANEAHKK